MNLCRLSVTRAWGIAWVCVCVCRRGHRRFGARSLITEKTGPLNTNESADVRYLHFIIIPFLKNTQFVIKLFFSFDLCWDLPVCCCWSTLTARTHNKRHIHYMPNCVFVCVCVSVWVCSRFLNGLGHSISVSRSIFIGSHTRATRLCLYTFYILYFHVDNFHVTKNGE